MKKFISLFLIVLAGLQVEAQDFVVKGTVTDAQDGSSLAGINVIVKGTSLGTVTDIEGKYELKVKSPKEILIFSMIGYSSQEVPINGRKVIDVVLQADVTQLSEVVITGFAKNKSRKVQHEIAEQSVIMDAEFDMGVVHNTEEYATINENTFRSPVHHPYSTFSIDVDNASYSNIRRFINNGQRPPIDAVRIEEMINYFEYNYGEPGEEHPVAVHTEVSSAPWNSDHMLLRIGMKAKDIPVEEIPPNNLVFLIDVSGSMQAANKLPLLKESFKLLVEKIRPYDRIAIVVYAGAAGLVLPSTEGTNKDQIINALDQLTAGGSTAGGEGLKLAYKIATENFIQDGNNRIILASDGDFNVGRSSNADMERLITEKRKSGIYLSVLGYGMGNYKDSKMEILADKGNGNYAYIDNLREAQKVLVDQMAGTLLTVAKDVKLQLEFNPAHVSAYRLIGYENRKLNKEDFNDDKKDAGEIGAGHTVTALYEIIPAGVENKFSADIDPLKYQKGNKPKSDTNELLTVKVRYKKPVSESSIKFEKTVINTQVEKMSQDMQWASAVAAFGMLLRESEYINGFSYNQVLKLAREAKGEDEKGYRIEFINMVRMGGSVASR